MRVGQPLEEPERLRLSKADLKGWSKQRKSDSPAATTPSRSFSCMPRTLKQWVNTSMCDAIQQAVGSGKFGINQSARMYSVPPTTLKDRISGLVKHRSRPGPHPISHKLKKMNLLNF